MLKTYQFSSVKIMCGMAGHEVCVQEHCLVVKDLMFVTTGVEM